jgi:hypothetical protein
MEEPNLRLSFRFRAVRQLEETPGQGLLNSLPQVGNLCKAALCEKVYLL